MKKGLIIIAVFLLAVMAVFGGCKDKKQGESGEDYTESTFETVPPLLDVEVDKLITAEQVSEVLGFASRQPHLADDNTTARFYSEDSTAYLEISLQEASLDTFNETVALYEDAVDASVMGQTAKWSEGQNQLLVYSGKYMISVTVYDESKTSSDLLESSTRIAEILLQKLGVSNE